MFLICIDFTAKHKIKDFLQLLREDCVGQNGRSFSEHIRKIKKPKKFDTFLYRHFKNNVHLVNGPGGVTMHPPKDPPGVV